MNIRQELQIYYMDDIMSCNTDVTNWWRHINKLASSNMQNTSPREIEVRGDHRRDGDTERPVLPMACSQGEEKDVTVIVGRP